jgi:hypothetical protein
MLSAAIDIHKRTFHAPVSDVESGEAFECRFGATREELNDWVPPSRWDSSPECVSGEEVLLHDIP